MNDYRIGFAIEDITDDAGNQYSALVDTLGRRYTIRSYDMRTKPFPTHYQDDFVNYRIPVRWDLALELVEVPKDRP